MKPDLYESVIFLLATDYRGKHGGEGFMPKASCCIFNKHLCAFEKVSMCGLTTKPNCFERKSKNISFRKC